MTIELGFRLKSEPMVTETKKRLTRFDQSMGFFSRFFFFFFFAILFIYSNRIHMVTFSPATTHTLATTRCVRKMPEVRNRIDNQNDDDDAADDYGISVDAVWNCFSDSQRLRGASGRTKK